VFQEKTAAHSVGGKCP